MDERDEQHLLDMVENLVAISRGNRLASWAGAISGWLGAIVAVIALVALILLAT